MSLMHLTAYRFKKLTSSELLSLRNTLKKELTAMALKGSVLLGTEGFNMSLAGKPESVASLKTYFETQPLFQGLAFRESKADIEPFKRLLVKIKPEIVTFGVEGFVRDKHLAPYISPLKFKRWYDEGHDMLVLDTRNDFEIILGTFKDAVHLNIRRFNAFKEALNLLDETDKKRPVVTFCTGGIRCEKAAPYLVSQGFEQVYQLEGGIINYFHKCKNAYYQGECFVFDRRIAVNENLEETPTIQCWDCRSPLTASDQSRPEKACP